MSVTLKYKKLNEKVETVQAATISFDQVGLNYYSKKTNRIHIIEYRFLESWEAKAQVTKAQVESSEKFHENAEDLGGKPKKKKKAKPKVVKED